MTTKLRQPRQEAEEPPEPPGPATTAVPEPDPYASIRQEADQLAEALGKLEQIEADIIRVRGELETTEARRAELLPQEDPDLDQLSNLGSRVNACQARLEHLAGRLLDTQKDVQSKFLALGGEAGTLYQRTRLALIEQATDQILELLHPAARTLQRQTVWHSLSQFGIAVVDARERFEITIHPLASNPLEDTPAKAWSQERESTMKLVRQEAKTLLERLPKLLDVSHRNFQAAPLQTTQATA